MKYHTLLVVASLFGLVTVQAADEVTRPVVQKERSWDIDEMVEREEIRKMNLNLLERYGYDCITTTIAIESNIGQKIRNRRYELSFII